MQGKKGGGFASLFIKTVEVPEDTPPAAAPVQQQQQANLQPPPGSTYFQAQSPSMIGQEDKEIKAQLLSAIEKSNVQGYDYFEFAKAIDAQASIIPSEATRFQSTYAVASTMGVTVPVLLSSAQHYLDILAGKEKEFLEAAKQHAAEAVEGKQEQISQIDVDTKKKADQIQQLTQEINGLQEQKKTLTNEISTNQIKIETMKNNFNATMKSVADRIKNDVAKIQQYLSPVGGK
jgi:hypothetical protein